MDYQQHYDNAAADLSQKFEKSAGEIIISNDELRYVLATIFFLTYINVGSITPCRFIVYFR